VQKEKYGNVAGKLIDLEDNILIKTIMGMGILES
jgi:hypothetical protein